MQKDIKVLVKLPLFTSREREEWGEREREKEIQ